METSLQEFLKKQYTEVLLPQAEKVDYPHLKGLRQIAQNIEKGHFKPTVVGVLNLMYALRRKVSYRTDFEKEDQLRIVLDQPSEKIEKIDGNSWFFRAPKNRHEKGWNLENHAVERLVVNASPEKEMIPKLDDFCVRNSCMYKVPNPYFFGERLDTVIVYAYKSLSEKAKEEFVQMMSPCVRRERPMLTNALEGNRLADGIFSAKEVSPLEVVKMKKEIKNRYPPEVSKGVNDFIGGDRISLGMHYVVKDFLKVYDDEFFGMEKKRNLLKTNTLCYDSVKKKVVFIPKEGVPETEAYKALKALGFSLNLGAENEKTKKRFFTADLKEEHNRLIFKKMGMSFKSPLGLFLRREGR